MTRIQIENGVLFVDGDGDDRIYEWDHRVFFTIAAGFQLDEYNRRYIFDDKARIQELILDTVSYLDEEGIDYVTDDTVSNLLEDLLIEQQQFVEALEIGVAIKEPDRKIDTQILGLVRQLKPYQHRAFEHLLAVRHGANFSVPGSGKTSVIYAVFEKLRSEGIVDKLLVIGPRSSFRPWEDEAKACFGKPIKAVRLTGTKSKRRSLYISSGDYILFLCTYQTAVNDVDDLIKLCEKYKLYVVIDESHNIKKLEGGVWSEAALRIAPYALRRAVLSGTPMPNDHTDLWTQITFLWPGEHVLGDRESYRYRCKNDEEVSQIKQLVRPLFIRTKKSELSLPEPVHTKIYCDMSPYQTLIYRAFSAKYLREISSQQHERFRLRQWRRARMIRLIQTASNPALLTQYSEEFDVPPLSGERTSITQLIDNYPQYETPAKIIQAINLVHDLLVQGKKVIVWTSFVHNIRMLQSLLQDIEPFIVYGAVPRDESEDIEFNREQQIQQFKEIDRPVVLLANPAACAESISLHKTCRDAIYLDRTFNCGQYLQSLDRIHRIGLEKEDYVTYYILLARGTIDETIDRRLIEKETNMLRLLEDDLPVGAFEVEDHLMASTESEETRDFEETIKDIKQQLENEY